MLKIFAKHLTSEKVLVVCSRQQVGTVMEELNKQLGGSWVLVDRVKPGECLKFDDSQVYEGFTPKIERYSSGITELKPT